MATDVEKNVQRTELQMHMDTSMSQSDLGITLLSSVGKESPILQFDTSSNATSEKPLKIFCCLLVNECHGYRDVSSVSVFSN